MFKLNEYLVEGFTLSFDENSKGEGQIILESARYYEKGILTDIDVKAIKDNIMAIKAKRAKEAEIEKAKLEAERLAMEEAERLRQEGLAKNPQPLPLNSAEEGVVNKLS